MSTSERARHEPYELGTRPLYLAALVLGVLVALALLAARGLFGVLEVRGVRNEAPRRPLAEEIEAQPEPRLLEDPDAYRAQYLREQRERDAGYGWVDRERGVVRIPVERARELVEKEGLPFR